jgi:hypothetical protein
LRRVNHCGSEKAINISYSTCVFVALIILHAIRMCHIIFPSVACPVGQYFFPYYFINGTIFRAGGGEGGMNAKCVF